ncbi:MAG TPA: MCE family protein [Candidatus Cloacimonetes bacterium]|nr:MCE family protein [Candidatus Cloacimonadota bacterium]
MKFHQNKKSLEFKVGLFSMAAIAILILGYSWFSGFMEKQQYSNISVKFQNIGNIEKGSTVSILGVKKGKIKDIEINHEGVILHLLVELDFPLKKGTEFRIIETNIMGSVQVEITPGNDHQNLDLTQIQTGQKSYGISTLVSELSNISQNLQKLFNNTEDKQSIMESVHSVLDSSRSLIEKLNYSYYKNSENIDKIISNISVTSEKLAKMINNNEENVSLVFDSFKSVIYEIENTLKKIEKISGNFENISDKMESNDSSFHRLITEKKLYDNLMEATTSLDSLLKDIKKDPGRYFKVKIF